MERLTTMRAVIESLGKGMTNVTKAFTLDMVEKDVMLRLPKAKRKVICNCINKLKKAGFVQAGIKQGEYCILAGTDLNKFHSGTNLTGSVQVRTIMSALVEYFERNATLNMAHDFRDIVAGVNGILPGTTKGSISTNLFQLKKMGFIVNAGKRDNYQRKDGVGVDKLVYNEFRTVLQPVEVELEELQEIQEPVKPQVPKDTTEDIVSAMEFGDKMITYIEALKQQLMDTIDRLGLIQAKNKTLEIEILDAIINKDNMKKDCNALIKEKDAAIEKLNKKVGDINLRYPASSKTFKMSEVAKVIRADQKR